MGLSELRNSGWATGDSFRPAMYRLEPNTSYIVISTENSGTQIPNPVSASAAQGITFDRAVRSSQTNFNDGRNSLAGTLSAVSTARARCIHISTSRSVAERVSATVRRSHRRSTRRAKFPQ